MNDTQKTMLRIGISLVVGIAMGIVFLCNKAPWYFMLLSPIYTVGLVYGISRVGPWMLKYLGGMFKAAASLFLFRLAWWILLLLVILPIGLAVLFAACWIVGFPLAVIDVIKTLKANGFNMPKLQLHRGSAGADYDYDYDPDDDDY